MKKPYVRIACAIYDNLELLAMRGTEQTILYNDESAVKETRSKIVDIFTKEKSEFLRLENDMVIRLDHLISVGDLKIEGTC